MFFLLNFFCEVNSYDFMSRVYRLLTSLRRLSSLITLVESNIVVQVKNIYEILIESNIFIQVKYMYEILTKSST